MCLHTDNEEHPGGDWTLLLRYDFHLRSQESNALGAHGAITPAAIHIKIYFQSLPSKTRLISVNAKYLLSNT